MGQLLKALKDVSKNDLLICGRDGWSENINSIENQKSRDFHAQKILLIVVRNDFKLRFDADEYLKNWKAEDGNLVSTCYDLIGCSRYKTIRLLTGVMKHY